MKRLIIASIIALSLLSVWLVVPTGSSAQKVPDAKYPTLESQLAEKYMGESVIADSPLAQLIADNQDFSMLRPDEFGDQRGLPLWMRVWWRKNHPEVEYSGDDPTKGYPHVLKEILEWMMTHQDLKAGPGKQEGDGAKRSAFVDSLIGTNVRTSGLQTAARSESYIQINFFDPTKILAASNNIASGGAQGVYRSSDGGLTWAQSLLPLTSPDTLHSDPTVDFTSDGRAWSATLGISGSTLRLRNYFSTDNGATWTLDATPSGTQTNVDKEILWVDKIASSPFFGQTYAIWHNGNPAYMNRRTAGAGGTWLAAPIQVSGAESTGTAIGGDVKTNSTGDVFGFWPTTTSSKIFVVKSTNGGNSFSTPVQVAATLDTYDIGIPSMASRRALIYVSGGAYRTVSKNNVYAAWTDLSGDSGCTAPANEPGTNVASTCKTRIWFSRSLDGGTTWSVPVRINHQASLSDQFNQWLAVDDTTGNIGIMYYDTVADSGRKKTDVWFQTSFDDGATWGAAEKVTSAMTDETSAGADSGNQYGDYNGLSGYGNSFFPSWTDRRSAAFEEIWTAPITIGPPPPPAPVIQSTGVSITGENGIPANGVPDPGENITVTLGLHNIGNADTGNAVTATLQATGGVTNPSAAQNYGTLTFGGPTVTKSYTLRVNPAAACGSSITLTWTVQDGANSQNVTQTYSLGTPALSLTQNFDSVTAPALPAGWVQNQTSGTGITWVTSTTAPVNSAPNMAFANDPAAVNAAAIESPVFAVSSPVASLAFQKAFATENTFDGTVLEIKIGAGAWTDIVTAGGAFVTGGYNGTISTSFSSPIAGRQAWTGTSAAFTPTTVTLPAAANGQNVQLRWLMASDSSVASTGFRLDDVSVSAGVVCASVAFKARADYDGDGKTDVSVFRPSDGNWYVNRSTAGFGAMHWGVAGDVLVPGDYDGDGKADFAVYRPSDTANVTDFYVLNSSDLTFKGYSHGMTTDIPVPGDFDGDGKADIVVWRPSTGTFWMWLTTTQTTTSAQFGSTGDIPFAMDSDGDGKANFAVYRPSNNFWYIAKATGVPAQNFDAYQWGTTGDIIVPADYDGDGKEDVAVFRPSNGVWYIRQSSNGALNAIQFGANGDVPVPGDYDGDGKSDVAVFRAGVWYLNRSTSGFAAQSFGLAGDKPVPAAYHP